MLLNILPDLSKNRHLSFVFSKPTRVFAETLVGFDKKVYVFAKEMALSNVFGVVYIYFFTNT